MSTSPYVISLNNDRTCTKEKCEPFFIREWETVVIGTLIVGVMLYLMCSCGMERFATENNNKYVYDRLSSAQAHFTQDDRVGHDGTRTDIERFAIVTKAVANTPIQTVGQVQTGVQIPSKGPSVSKFTEFNAIDNIDVLASGEPDPVHMPETPDSVLEGLIRNADDWNKA